MIRFFSILRLADGLILVLAPQRVLGAAGARDDPLHVQRIVQLLGVRHVVQAMLVGARGDARALRCGAAVDALHGLSMAALARSDTRFRRPAEISAASASAWAVSGVWLARRLRQRRA